MEQSLDALEDDQRLKIEVKRLLQIDNPISYVHSDEIPFADSSLKIVVSGDKNSAAYKEQNAKLAAFRCKKCGQVMTQAVELNCGCVLCRKCLEEKDVQSQLTSSFHTNCMSTCMSTNISFSFCEATENRRIFCPCCGEEIYYAAEQHNIEEYTRTLTFRCCFEGCQFTGTYDQILQHVPNCDVGMQQFESKVKPYKRLLVFKDKQIRTLKSQLQDYFVRLTGNQGHPSPLHVFQSVEIEQPQKDNNNELRNTFGSPLKNQMALSTISASDTKEAVCDTSDH